MKRLLIILTCACLVLSLFFNWREFFPSKHTTDVARVLKTIPKEDREAIEFLFRSANSSFGYVLFGSKPMAHYCLLESTSISSKQICQADDLWFFFDFLGFTNLKTKRGLEKWKKYEHLFPSSNFILFTIHHPSHPYDWIRIVIINKSAFLQKIMDHIEDFKKVLGAHITPHKILESCLQDQLIFQRILNHDALQGILLGYGRHNAWLFHRRTEIEGIRQKQRFSLLKHSLFPSKGFATLDEEYAYVSQKLGSFAGAEIQDFNPLLICLPGFLADFTHSETQELKRAYKQDYKRLIKHHKQGNFLEVTLKQYTSDHEQGDHSAHGSSYCFPENEKCWQ